LRDLPQQKNPMGLCWGSSPFLSVPTFPWKYFSFAKQERSEKIKRELFAQGEVPVLVCSPEVQKHPQEPLPWENALVQEPPLQHVLTLESRLSAQL